MTQAELNTKRLEGKIAVITGGNSGIGLATAQRFVQEGVQVQGTTYNALDIVAVRSSATLIYSIDIFNW